ncbi:hypothetical protein [Streptomyces sp. NPDC046161]|uniref:hypothetical protein n=1 Tax=Streptomyces sp. NPDC046161 TaxID=3155132 RepID=UPI0033F34454
MAEPTAGEFAAALRRLTVPGIGPLAVMGEVRMAERFRSGSGGLRLTLAWPAGAASAGPGGAERHAVGYAGPGEGGACERRNCGGLVPVSW